MYCIDYPPRSTPYIFVPTLQVVVTEIMMTLFDGVAGSTIWSDFACPGALRCSPMQMCLIDPIKSMTRSRQSRLINQERISAER